MIPGEIIPKSGDIELNAGATHHARSCQHRRPAHPGRLALSFLRNQRCAELFDREKTRGMRLDIAAGTAVRFEPGQRREVTLVPYGGLRRVYGFQQKIMGAL
jgi:urease subunit beta